MWFFLMFDVIILSQDTLVFQVIKKWRLYIELKNKNEMKNVKSDC